MKQKLTKKQLKEIKEFANSLPITYYIASQKIVKSAKEILNTTDASPTIIELQEEIIKCKIKDDVKFVLNNDTYHTVNHYNRLKTIAYDSGEVGCRKYIDEQIKLHSGIPNEINLHSRII